MKMGKEYVLTNDIHNIISYYIISNSIKEFF